MTLLPREAGADFEARRIELNRLMREHFTKYSDAVVDLASNETIGDAGDETNKEFYADGVHLNAKGNALVAEMVAAKLAPLVSP